MVGLDQKSCFLGSTIFHNQTDINIGVIVNRELYFLNFLPIWDTVELAFDPPIEHAISSRMFRLSEKEIKLSE